MKKISIITTCLNSEKTIRETIESIHSQQGDFEIEHIITDAGSNDGTIEIIKSYGEKIKLFHTPGLNQSQGINYGLKAATGDIMAFLNADDLYCPGAFKSVFQAFEANPDKNWLAGYCGIIDGESRDTSSWISAYKNFFLRRYSYRWLLVENFICQPAVFFRARIFKDYGYFSEQENYCMDYEFWLRIGRGENPIILEKELSKFRRTDDTKSNKGFEKQFRDDMRLGLQYARQANFPLAALLKRVSYLRTVGIYKIIYR